MNHTPGPWIVDNTHVKTAINTPTKHIAMVNWGTHVESAEHEANCRLIAAAPEKLEMLEHVLDLELITNAKTGHLYCPDCGVCEHEDHESGCIFPAIKKLIKKARGES